MQDTDIKEFYRGIKQGMSLEDFMLRFDELLNSEFENGYDNGYQDGNRDGNDNGYEAGYSDGNADGYARGLEERE